MINNSIYDQIQQFVDGQFQQMNHTALQLLYGYAKLMSMDAGILNVLFSKEEEQKELADIRNIIQENNIDINLLKVTVPLLLSNGQDSEAVHELKEILEPMLNDDIQHNSAQILKSLLDMNIPEMALVTTGHSLDDVLNYVDSCSDKRKTQSKRDKKTVDLSSESRDKAPEMCQSSDIDSEDQGSSKDIQQHMDNPEMDYVAKRERFSILIEKTTRLYDRLKCKIMGQSEAVRMFAEGYFQSEVLRSEEEDCGKPSATFLFAGPPGVGKTYLASTAAGMLNMPFLRLDMSEYYSESSVHELSGVSKVYAAPKPGVLTEFVRNNPRSVILMDEIEKAHEKVIYQFLQVLDGGVLTDSYTEESVDFSGTILIFTTNVGKSLYEDRERENLSSIPKSVIVRALEQERDEYGRSRLPAAICSRFSSGNLIMFNHLGVHNLLDIINDRFGLYSKKMKDLYDYKVEIDDKLSSVLLFSQSSGMDARNISAQSIIMLKNEMYEFGRHIPNLNKSLSVLEKMKFSVDLSKSSGEIKALFNNDDAANIVFVGSREDLNEVPVSSKCVLHYAADRMQAMDLLTNNDIEFVVLDPIYNIVDENSDYLSLDDRKSEGIYTFEEIMDKFPKIPLYILEKKNINNEDKSIFLERGARGFIKMENKVDFSNNLSHISDILYLQRKVDDLSGRGRVLSYNTAQHFTDGGSTAELVFYDFKIKLAADASENRMMVSAGEKPTDKFADVIGAENAKKELEYFITLMKNPKKHIMGSSRPPKGILLYGPPGTGKTMLARAMASECEASFFPVTAAEFQERYVGEGEKKIRDLFKTARKFAPSIIFIDEIDAIGKERTGSSSTHHTETLLNTLLTEMDGFKVDSSKPVFVVAATNYDLDGSVSGKASSIDPALLRRFDNRILVDLPNEREREAYLQMKLEKEKLSGISDEAVHNIAQRTTGESLAILQNILELAVRNAGRAGRMPVDDDLLNAMEEYMYGEKKDWGADYYQGVARHEAGHAYICHLSGEKPSYVTIVSRGSFGGYMQHANSETMPQYTKEQMFWNIRTALAGRAAELEFYGEDRGINTGVSSDLEQATRLAMNMICRYGMNRDNLISCSPDTMLRSSRSGEFLDEVNTILNEEMERTRKLIRDGRDKVERLADYLLDNNQATEKVIEHIFTEDC